MKNFAKTLLEDKKYLEGKKMMLEALKKASSSLKKPASRATSNDEYRQLLERAASLRGNALYYPYVGSGLGNGLLVELADGTTKYDLISGIGTHYFGHTFLPLAEELLDAAVQDIVMQGNLQQNEDSILLLEKLTKAAQMDHALLTTSGAMACENALKIIFQKNSPRYRLFAFEGCFMGRTTTLTQITDKPSFREGLPATIHVDYLPFYDPRDPEGNLHRTLNAMLRQINRYPKQHAVICIEPVQGENGFYTGDKRFFKEICALCKKEGIAVLADEVQTFARTPSLFAFQYYEMQEFVDVVTIGKVSQVAATLWKASYNPKPGLLSQTFTGATSSIRAALFLLNHIEKSNFFGETGKIASLHRTFANELHAINSRHPGLCEGPYGIGSMIAFTTQGGDPKKAAAFAQRLFENGVIGFVAGSHPVRIRFLVPPGIITEESIKEICAIIETTIVETKEK